ncbi:hypothetical protein B2J93_2872 [Marssonina coronariae]|uniref:Uncharacterized protein n=1 Tax=Diplocarpon coronariae TaxID=2795749 RepID=A0A218YVS4_9HELO|nr:hypothetical protein B2J93_2872 [Marssonina coronariae]
MHPNTYEPGTIRTPFLSQASAIVIFPIVVPASQAVSFITTVPGFLWSASILVEMPQRLAPAWVAIGIDLKVGVLAIAVTRGGKYVFKTRRK